MEEQWQYYQLETSWGQVSAADAYAISAAHETTGWDFVQKTRVAVFVGTQLKMAWAQHLESSAA